MSAIFPKRGRRQNTADDSFVDLDAPPPITEKRHPSPFSYLRIRKRSTEGPKKGSPPKDTAVRRYDSVDSFHALHDYDIELMKPLPPVPPLLNHNRGYSDPQLIYGAHVYPQVRSSGSDSSNDSGMFRAFPANFFVPSKFNLIFLQHRRHQLDEEISERNGTRLLLKTSSPRPTPSSRRPPR